MKRPEQSPDECSSCDFCRQFTGRPTELCTVHTIDSLEQKIAGARSGIEALLSRMESMDGDDSEVGLRPEIRSLEAILAQLA